MKRSSLIYISILLFATVCGSCKKKSQKTAKVNLQFSFAHPGASDHVLFNSGSVYVGRVSFTGKRTQSTDVSFNDYPAKTISFASYNSSPILTYDIPQGTYSGISMEVELSKDNAGNGITLSGSYNSPNPNVGVVPIQFEFNVGDVLKAAAENSSGGNEITLSEKNTTSVQVIINPVFWFGVITPNNLDNAPQSVVAGKSTIVINPGANQSIYNNVLNRIDKGTKIIFN